MTIVSGKSSGRAAPVRRLREGFQKLVMSTSSDFEDV